MAVFRYKVNTKIGINGIVTFKNSKLDDVVKQIEAEDGIIIGVVNNDEFAQGSTGEHSYFEVIKLCDGTIRHTSTDGDSLSVRESLFLGKCTLASDVVSRPVGCLLYSRDSLSQELSKLLEMPYLPVPKCNVIDATDEIIEVYSRCIGR